MAASKKKFQTTFKTQETYVADLDAANREGEPATVIEVGTRLHNKLRNSPGDSVVKEISIVQQQDTGEWKTLLVVDRCMPGLPPTQMYLDDLLRYMKRQTITPFEPQRQRTKKNANKNKVRVTAMQKQSVL
jgi:hypothetical protein